MPDAPLPPLDAGAGLRLRAPAEDDATTLLVLLREEEVARWWGPWDADAVRRELLSGRTPGWVVEEAGAVAGWLQLGAEEDPMYEHVGLDLALGAGVRGRGVGRRALRAALAFLRAAGHHRFTIDPAAANAAAIRCYAAVGFRPVGVLRAYERGPDGRWRDGLLMDLLAEELVLDDRPDAHASGGAATTSGAGG
jgi:aminoglycoside 6'-N-acetyltransferase